MVGHHQKTVVVDLKSFPVQGRMCLQCLVMQESVFSKIPLIDNGKLRHHLPGIRHHYEYLSKSKNPSLNYRNALKQSTERPTAFPLADSQG